MSPDERLRQITESQHGLAGTRQLTDSGISTSFVRARIRSGAIDRVSRQVVRLAGAPLVPESNAMAAVLDAPEGAVLSHTAAAALWRIPGFHLDRDLHVVVAARGQPPRGRLARIHYHLDLPRDQLMICRNVPVTSPALTMFHLAAICSLGRVARAVDHAWAEGLLTGPEVFRLLDRLGRSGRNGITKIRTVMGERGADYVPPASGLEARFQEIVARLGDIPPLRRQVDLGGETWVGRIDFVWDDVAGGIEVQSQRFHSSYLDREHDQARLARFKDAGFEVIEVWDRDIFHRPWEVADRVRNFRWWLEGLLPERPS